MAISIEIQPDAEIRRLAHSITAKKLELKAWGGSGGAYKFLSVGAVAPHMDSAPITWSPTTVQGHAKVKCPSQFNLHMYTEVISAARQRVDHSSHSRERN